MSLSDIFQPKQDIEINGKKYSLEYDNTGYAVLQTVTKKGLFKLHDLLIVENNLNFQDCIEICCCGMLKHHKESEIDEVRKYLYNNIFELAKHNNAIISAFINPLLPPDEVRKMSEKADELEKNIKKKKK